MARIIYAVAGEGMGHATRSKAVIDHLKKDHELLILSDDRAYRYLSDHYQNVHKITTLHIGYQNNQVSMLDTVLINFNNIPEFMRTWKKVKRLANNFRPDLLINDFTFIPNYYALANKIPIITLDNEHIISKTKIDFPRRCLVDYIKTWIVINFIVPKADFHIATTFFYPEIKSKNTALFTQPIRKGLSDLKPENRGHVLVYQTSPTNHALFEVLAKVPAKFVVYGQDVKKQYHNITFKEFNGLDFFKDLASCRAVIQNGGFSLMNEALYFQKPVLAIPVERQFEQILNAAYLEKMGYGIYLKKNDEEKITEFLANLSRYSPKLEGQNDLFEFLDKKIKELC